MRNRAVGNTIAEYALIGAILLLVMISVIIGLGKNFNNALIGLKGDMIKSTDSAAAHQALLAASAAANRSGSGNSNGTVCLSSGQCVSASNQGGTTTTTGSNGTTFGPGNVSTAAGNAALQQLMASDPTVRALVTQLAMRGHDLSSQRTADMIANMVKGWSWGGWGGMGGGGKVDRTAADKAAFLAALQKLNAYLQNQPGSLPDKAQVIIAQNAKTIMVTTSPTTTTTSSNTICKSGGNTSTCVKPVSSTASASSSGANTNVASAGTATGSAPGGTTTAGGSATTTTTGGSGGTNCDPTNPACVPGGG